MLAILVVWSSMRSLNLNSVLVAAVRIDFRLERITSMKAFLTLVFGAVNTSHSIASSSLSGEKMGGKVGGFLRQ